MGRRCSHSGSRYPLEIEVKYEEKVLFAGYAGKKTFDTIESSKRISRVKVHCQRCGDKRTFYPTKNFKLNEFRQKIMNGIRGSANGSK